MYFRNRTDAGVQLAELLATYHTDECVVYALPRGGVPVAVPVAEYLQSPLDVVITCKIVHPGDPEYAIGAVSEDGAVYWNEHIRATLDASLCEEAVHEAREEAVRRQSVYRTNMTRLSCVGKVAIIVDDGIATGYTMRAALQSLIEEQPARLVCAVPVGPSDTMDNIRPLVDDLVVVAEVPSRFGAVGVYYDDFSQTSDEEVVALLRSVTS